MPCPGIPSLSAPMVPPWAATRSRAISEAEAAARRVGPPVEAVEDAVQVGRGNSLAGVCHRELDPSAVDRGGEAEPPGGMCRIATASVSAVTGGVAPWGLTDPGPRRRPPGRLLFERHKRTSSRAGGDAYDGEQRSSRTAGRPLHPRRPRPAHRRVPRHPRTRPSRPARRVRDVRPPRVVAATAPSTRRTSWR